MKFSITIPTYKTAFLAEAIESVLSQTYQDFELIIVDDCSPEDVHSIVSRYQDNRISYYRNENNCGAVNVVDNWNICLSYCTGEYVICMGDDDRLKTNCLEEYQYIIEKYPGLGVYHAWTEIINEKSEVFKLQEARPEWEGPASLLWHRWNGRNMQYIGDFCFDIKRLKEDGGFVFIPLAWGTDDVTAVRAARYGGIAQTRIPCFQYRDNELTITRSGYELIKIEALLRERDLYLNMLETLDDSLVVPRSLHLQDEISEVEQLYLASVKQQLAARFSSRISHYIKLDIRSHYFRGFAWLLKAKRYGLTMKRIVTLWVKALVNDQ